MKRLKIIVFIYILVHIVGCGGGSDAGGVSEPVIEWMKQFGTDKSDSAESIAIDKDGNVYIAGITLGDLQDTNAGGIDGYISKVTGDGAEVWTGQFGSPETDRPFSITMDDKYGHLYIVGYTNGDLDGTNIGSYDNFFIRLKGADPDEGIMDQFGTDKYDEVSYVITDKDGNICIAGYTNGDLEGTNIGMSDIFIVKLNSDGTEGWTKQYGTVAQDRTSSIATDKDGNLYGINAGFDDIFITKFKGDGTEVWTQQYGTQENDYASSVVIDKDGNLYIAGSTLGSLDGNTNIGSYDIFIRKFKSDGTKVWTKQYGTDKRDSAKSITIDKDGNLYIAGYTEGNLEGNTNAGGSDIFLMKLSLP